MFDTSFLNNPSMNKFKSFITYESFLFLFGLLFVFNYLVLVMIVNIDRSTFNFELYSFIIFLFFFITVFIVHKYYSSIRISSFLPFVLIISFSIIFQIIIILSELSLSDDLFRFYFEGKAIINGINPYITAVQDLPQNLHDQYYQYVNNAEIPSPYPPLALIMFAFLYLIVQNPIIYRLTFSFFFLLSILIGYFILGNESKWKLIVYAWNPLLHLETANGVHFDGLVVLVVMVFLVLLKNQKKALAGTMILIGFLLKFYPIILIPIYWRKLGKRGLIPVIAGLAIYLAFIFAIPQTLEGLLIYLDFWYFNSSIFWFIDQIFHSFILSRLILGSVLLIMFIFIILKSEEIWKSEKFSDLSLFVIGTMLLLQPVFHPWYIFWVFPFILFSKKLKYSWIILSGTLIWSYNIFILYDTTQVWIELDIIRVLVWIPFYITLIIENNGILKTYFRKLEFSLNALYSAVIN